MWKQYGYVRNDGEPRCIYGVVTGEMPDGTKIWKESTTSVYNPPPDIRYTLHIINNEYVFLPFTGRNDMHPENRINLGSKSETFEYKIRDNEGRLWDFTTDANCDIMSTAIKFLRNVDSIKMVSLIDLLESYGYSVEANLVRQPNIDFEL